MLSIITPTHNPRFISETHDSLKLQGESVPYEWVICPSPYAVSHIPSQVRNDPHVRIVPYPGEHLIGAIKKFAFDQGRGDALIELDHDDLLLPGALTAIQDQVDKGADFVYSDTASFMEETRKGVVYDPSYGWKSYPMTVYGRTFYAAQCFEINARSLCDLAFAPDHVRCWTRRAYALVGGHNPQLLVGDDHELMCRTYLAGCRFASTGSCHYLYRIHDSNTVQARWTLIQQQSFDNRFRYLRPMVEEQARRSGYPGCLLYGQLPCAWDPQENSFAYIVAHDVLQTLNLSESIQFMNKAYRALLPGGWLLIDVPSSDDADVLDQPTMKSYYSPESFEWYSNQEFATLDSRIQCRFQAVNVGNVPVVGEKPRLNVRADLLAMKGQVVPGLCKI